MGGKGSRSPNSEREDGGGGSPNSERENGHINGIPVPRPQSPFKRDFEDTGSSPWGKLAARALFPF